jgi:hypothetical protein
MYAQLRNATIAADCLLPIAVRLSTIRSAERPGGHAPVLPTPFHRKKVNRLPELIFTTRNVIKVGPDLDDVRHQPLRHGGRSVHAAAHARLEAMIASRRRGDGRQKCAVVGHCPSRLPMHRAEGQNGPRKLRAARAEQVLSGAT